MEDGVALGIPLDFPGKGQPGAGLALDGDLERRTGAGGGQRLDQGRRRGLQGAGFHARPVEVYRNNAGPPQPPDFFAQQFPGLEFQLRRAGRHIQSFSCRFRCLPMIPLAGRKGKGRRLAGGKVPGILFGVGADGGVYGVILGMGFGVGTGECYWGVV